MRFYLLILATLSVRGLAQSAQVPAVPVTGTVTTPSCNISVTVPKNGGTFKFTCPGVTIPVQNGTTAATAAPISLSGYTANMTIQVSPTSTVITNPDGSKTITGVTVTLQKVSQ